MELTQRVCAIALILGLAVVVGEIGSNARGRMTGEPSEVRGAATAARAASAEAEEVALVGGGEHATAWDGRM